MSAPGPKADHVLLAAGRGPSRTGTWPCARAVHRYDRAVPWDVLTDEQREIRELVRTLARERVAPRARRDRGGVQGLRHERPAAGGSGARVARSEARRLAGTEGGVPAEARERGMGARIRADGGR